MSNDHLHGEYSRPAAKFQKNPQKKENEEYLAAIRKLDFDKWT